MKQVVARLVEMAAPSEFIPMRTLITKAGGTAALRKMSHSKAAIALKNAAKELQAERKAKGLGWKLDKAQAQEWLDTNTPKRAPGSGSDTKPKAKALTREEYRKRRQQYKKAKESREAKAPKAISRTSLRQQAKEEVKAIDRSFGLEGTSLFKGGKVVIPKNTSAGRRIQDAFNNSDYDEMEHVIHQELVKNAGKKMGYDKPTDIPDHVYEELERSPNFKKALTKAIDDVSDSAMKNFQDEVERFAASKRRGSSSKAGKAGKQGSSLPPGRKSIAQIKRERRGKEYTPLTREEVLRKAREGRKRAVDENGNPIQFNGFTERDYGKW